jgi:hypothetical protein
MTPDKHYLKYAVSAIAIAAICAFALIAFHTHRDGLSHPDCAICVVISSQAISLGVAPIYFAVLSLCCILSIESNSNSFPESPLFAISSRAPPFCC